MGIQFLHIGSPGAPGPSSSQAIGVTWCHNGINEFKFGSDVHISVPKNFAGKGGATRKLYIVMNQHPELYLFSGLRTECNRIIREPCLFPSKG